MTFRESIRRRGRGVVPFHEHDGSDISGEIVASVIKVIQLLGGTITGEEIIIAGGVDGILRSDNFVAGSAGWRARGDGNFEAQDGIFRGTLDADDIVAGILVAARIAAGSLDGDKITAGTLDADRITVGTITAKRLILGSADNLIQNPGFEADMIDGPLDPHNYDADGGGVWGDEGTAQRSGGRAADFVVGSQSSDANLALNGSLGDTGAHPSASEGDVFYLSFFARSSGTGTKPDVDAILDWRDEDGSSLSQTNGVDVTTTGSYQLVEVSGTAPAGTVYVAFRARVIVGGASTAGVIIDDVYARRKTGTLIIEDQAVDIVRMLDPVFQDGANGKATDITVNTTESEAVTATVTLASWVGEVNCILSGTLQMTDSTERLVTLFPEIGGTVGEKSSHEISNADISETISFSVQQHRLITSPGSSVKFALRSKVSTGSNVLNQHEFAALLTGIR